MSKQHKPLLAICHNDTDGCGSAICIINHIKQKYGHDAECHTVFLTYKNVEMYLERVMDTPDKYEKIFIADIHVSPELMDDLNSVFDGRIILLDHHDSASNLKDKKNCIIITDGSHCGASLCYKYLLKDEGLEYLHLTSLVAICYDYDLWHHKLPNKIAKNMNFLYYYYWGEKFIERFGNGFDGFNNEEKLFLENKWKAIEESFRTTNFIDMLSEFEEYKGKFCSIIVSHNKDGEVNELCEYALNVLKYEIVMFINTAKRKVSVRASNKALEKGLHVGNFHLELLCGGGHAAAGGFSYSDEDHLETICNKFVEKIIELNI